MGNENTDKMDRVLDVYSKLMNGYVVNKAEEAHNYGVNERSIQRDIEDIRIYMDKNSLENGVRNTVVYDRLLKGYRLEQIYDMNLSNGEILAICKILLDSRAFTKKGITGMISRLINCCVPKVNHKDIKDLIQNEEYHYMEPRNRSDFIDKIWDIGKAIREHSYMEIVYQRLEDKAPVRKKVKPVSVMFIGYCFYMMAFIDDEEVNEELDLLNDPYPSIYRMDMIRKYRILDEQFRIPYSNRFEEGEFRKRVQFMYGGKLQLVRFTCPGKSVKAVMSRLPMARVEGEKDGVYTMSAELFEKEIETWLISQGDMVKIIDVR